MPFRIPFAGEGEFFTPDSVLSNCYGALLPMFDTMEATTLRQLCREFRSTVADFPWEDEETVIMGSVAAWRACFPRARCANVNEMEYDGEPLRRNPVVDADFVHFVGLRRLKMSACDSITDAAFVHLKGIHTLDMSGCEQTSITDAAFEHLQGIHTLIMSYCDLAVTDAAFVYLKGIHSLNLWYFGDDGSPVTSAVFVHLKGIKRLNIGHCGDLNLTDDSLKGIEWLGMYNHSQAQIDQAMSLGYPVEQEFCKHI
jgi:hypothetical protein